MAYLFNKDEGVGETLFKWWQALDEHRADRAEIRRAGTITDVVLTGAYQRLHGRLEPGRWKHAFQRDHLAAVVGLLAHLKAESELSLPQAMSQRAEGSDRNPVSEARFRRLLATQDLDALFTGLRRVLPLIEHKTHPLRLMNDVFRWDDEVRKRWAYEYQWPAA